MIESLHGPGSSQAMLCGAGHFCYPRSGQEPSDRGCHGFPIPLPPERPSKLLLFERDISESERSCFSRSYWAQREYFVKVPLVSYLIVSGTL